MALDTSGVSYFLPLFAFLIVVFVSFVVIVKAKFTESKWLQIFLSLLIAVIFVSFGGAVKYIENVVPWFAVLLISLFLILMITGFVGDPIKGWLKGIGGIFVIVLFVIFIVSAYLVFSSYINPYLPWSNDYGAGSSGEFVYWISTPRIAGGILLAITAALVSWVLVSSVGGKK